MHEESVRFMAGESDRTAFIDRAEYYKFHNGLFNISYCHYNQ